MPSIRGLKALSASLVLALSFSSLAASPSDAERSLKLDQAVQALKDEVLDFNRQATAVEVDTVLPPQDRLNVYLTVKAPALLVQDVTVALDNNPAEVYHYDDIDSRALLAKDGSHRILRAKATPGTHRVRVSFTGKMADAKPGDAPITDRYEVMIDKPIQVTDLEFVIAPETRFRNTPRLRLKQWRPAQ